MTLDARRFRCSCSELNAGVVLRDLGADAERARKDGPGVADERNGAVLDEMEAELPRAPSGNGRGAGALRARSSLARSIAVVVDGGVLVCVPRALGGACAPAGVDDGYAVRVCWM